MKPYTAKDYNKIPKVLFTDSMADALGFTEYIDGCGDYGTRHLTFQNSEENSVIHLTLFEHDDFTGGSYGYGYVPFIPSHFSPHSFEKWVIGETWKDDKKILDKKLYDYDDIYFLHELYELILQEIPEVENQFLDKCKKAEVLEHIENYKKVK